VFRKLAGTGLAQTCDETDGLARDQRRPSTPNVKSAPARSTLARDSHGSIPACKPLSYIKE
jgi:hypothetical protein